MISVQPWQLANASSPDQRLRLAQFWLAAPEDQLEQFWRGPVGEASRQAVRTLTPSLQFPADQIALRDQLNARLKQGLQGPGVLQVWLATFLFSPPGLFAIQGPERFLPAWLLPDYQALYGQPRPQAEPQFFAAAPPPPAAAVQPQAAVPAPDFGAFPTTLQELQGNRLQLNRMLGLANLYYIDPEDQEILVELQQLRTAFAKAVQTCPEEQLESLWQGDIGDRYWAVVRSGIQKEPLSPVDQAIKDTVSRQLTPSLGGGFGQPGAVGAMLVAMLYFAPGTMKVDGADQKLPAWLLPGYQEIFAKAVENAL